MRLREWQPWRRFLRWSVLDWRTSRLRARSIRDRDPDIRLVYLELVFALRAEGCSLSADPVLLADSLLLPPAVIARVLPIVVEESKRAPWGIKTDGKRVWLRRGGRHGRRASIPQWVRRLVFARDGTCRFCGVAEDLQLDHIERWRDGGEDTPENLRLLCAKCNLERG